MKNIKLVRTFRSIALALVCVFTLCALVPADFGAQTGILAKTEAAESPVVIGASTFTRAVGFKSTLYLTSGDTNVKFYSSDPKVLKINKNTGKYTALKPGTVTISAKIDGKVKGKATFTVVKNYKKGSSTVKKTGYSSYTQAGKPCNPTVKAQLQSAQYLSSNKIRLKFVLKHYSGAGWNAVRKINQLTVKADGVTLVSEKNLGLTNGFALPAGRTITWTITLSGGYVKKFVELNKAKKLIWTLNWAVG